MEREAAREAEEAKQEAAELAAVQAMNAVVIAELELEALPGEATPLQRAQAGAKLEVARLQANVAYRKAGWSEPFPEARP